MLGNEAAREALVEAIEHPVLTNIVNGALLVGLVEQAKVTAFRRDLADGGSPSRIQCADRNAAIATIVSQNAGLNHFAVMAEIGEREGLAMLSPAPTVRETPLPPRYGLNDRGAVVQVQ